MNTLKNDHISLKDKVFFFLKGRKQARSEVQPTYIAHQLQTTLYIIKMNVHVTVNV